MSVTEVEEVWIVDGVCTRVLVVRDESGEELGAFLGEPVEDSE